MSIASRLPDQLSRSVFAARSATFGLLSSAALAVGFAALYAWTLLRRHEMFNTYAFDLGLLVQTAWNTANGRWFEQSIIPPANYVAEHLSPALALLSPLLLVWPTAESLLIVQSLAIGAAGIGIYLAARRTTGDTVAALLLQVAFGCAPIAGWVAIDEFHPISLAIPVATLATAALWSGRPRTAAAIAALGLLANEDAVVWIAPFGLLVAAVGRRKGIIPGFAVSALAVLWLAAYLFVVVPIVRPPEPGQATHTALRSFSCGETYEELATCLLDPARSLARATTPADREAVVSILGPTAGLGLLGPSFLVSLARWLVMLLGNDPPGFRLHYSALLIPAAYLSAAEAIGWLRRIAPRSPRALAAVVLLASIYGYWQLSPLPGGKVFQRRSAEQIARIDALSKAVALIPTDPNVSVVTTNCVIPHLALRRSIGLLSAASPADYELYDPRDTYPLTGEQIARLIAIRRADAEYWPIFDENGVVVLKREYHPPDRAIDAVFGGALRLEGYGVAATGSQVRLRLNWRSEAWLPADHNYFIHLVDADGKGFSQHDGALVDGQLPTLELKIGARVRDQVDLAAPPIVDWSRYHFEIGWYDWKTGERLKLANGEDHVDLPLALTGR